ncbi:MAG: chemotaxis protein CheD [Lachnospiraceae bacterium]|nr:chemotaxis protein CheD [Lachnospiraceae bacterium]
MGNMIRVGMADLNICSSPDAITTLGLGSCVGIILYDPLLKIAGLAHIMLPDSTQIRSNENAAKFADTGIETLLNRLIQRGAQKPRMIAKIAGGAQMFAFSAENAMLSIGMKNVRATKKKLNELGIRIIAEDTGDSYGRTIEFYPETGELLIKAVGKNEKII